MINLAVKENKERVTISLDKKILDAIKKNASLNQRTVSAEIVFMLLNNNKIEFEE